MWFNPIEAKEDPLRRDQAMEANGEQYTLLLHQNSFYLIHRQETSVKKRLTFIQRLLACVSQRK